MKNEYKVNKKLMMSWAREYHLVGSANIVLFVLWSLAGVIALSLMALYIVFGGDWLDWYIASLLLFLSVFKLFFSRFFAMSNRYKLFSRTYGADEWNRTIEFLDDEISITDHNATNKLRYDSIKKIKEKDNSVMIFFHNSLGLRLYKDAFVEGSWEECRELLLSKMEKKDQTKTTETTEGESL